MAESGNFRDKQLAFAAHIRDPQNVPAPEGIEDRRMAIYRDLFFNNLKSLLSNMFPVLKKLHSPEDWSGMIRQFMVVHRAKTPYFLQLPQEFLAFLEDEYAMTDADFPFLLELAHYEYTELALSISEAENDLTGIDTEGDLLAQVPIKSVLAWTLAYQYPVHRISSDFQPDAPGESPTYLAVYRDKDDKVGFLELNPLTAGLLDAIENNVEDATGEALLRELAKQARFPDMNAFIQHGLTALQEMRQLDIVIGAKPTA